MRWLSSILLPLLLHSQTVYPGKDWERWDKPESAGYRSSRLEALRAWLKTQDTNAMMVIVGGKVLFDYGDLAHVSKVASVRKSILAMLYGKYVVDGTIDLRKTVKDLGLDDKQKFIAHEGRATLETLLTARSGIYHPASAEDPQFNPPRGSMPPGTYFLYHNWDFNAAGTAFEKLAKKDIYEALESDLAKPIGMQDFDRAKQKKVSVAEYSVHPEYAMYLSTRDMARIGLLMLREGQWNGAYVLPPNWARHITRLVTPHHDMNPPSLKLLTRPGRWGYGTMWWVWDAPAWPGGAVSGPFQGAYIAWGANGQFITVLPAYDMVIAHKVDIETGNDGNVDMTEFLTIVQMIAVSECRGGRC
jgi:CubicO group peptidase (beta-lactamase class C family)